jgi:hypothetical protein
MPLVPECSYEPESQQDTQRLQKGVTAQAFRETLDKTHARLQTKVFFLEF